MTKSDGCGIIWAQQKKRAKERENLRETNQYHMSNIHYVEFPADGGSVQSGIRPAIIASNDIGNRFSPTVNVIPLTTSKSKMQKPYPMHVKVPACGGIRTSIALVEQMRPVPKDRISPHPIGTISDDVKEELGKALRSQFPFCAM